MTDQRLERFTAALADFAARTDLTPDARRVLTTLIEGSVEGFGVTNDGQLALTPKALARTLSIRSTSVLHTWRSRHIGPPFVKIRHGSQDRVLYPVAGVRKWLSELAFGGSYYPDPKVLAAFGLAPRDGDAEAA